VRAGLFKDVDVTLYWHAPANKPGKDRNLANTIAAAKAEFDQSRERTSSTSR